MPKAQPEHILEIIHNEKAPPLVMGILNVTPDSFYDGGMYKEIYSALKKVEYMMEKGADIIDIGGESTRPYSDPVSVEEEMERVIPVVKAVREKFPEAVISVDTYKAEVAKKALELGAHIINDVSAARFDPKMVDVLRDYQPIVIIMHMKGTPKDMQNDPVYSDVVAEVKSFLKERKDFLVKIGVPESNVIVDPGIGFGKRLHHNLLLIKHLSQFTEIAPVLIGPSRKSFIGEILSLPPAERLEGTLSSVAIAVYNGARIVRVHDVREAKRAVLVAKAIRDA